MCPVEIINNYKKPSEEVVTRNQDFEQLLKMHNHGRKIYRWKIAGACIFAATVIGLLIFFISGNEFAEHKLQPVVPELLQQKMTETNPVSDTTKTVTSDSLIPLENPSSQGKIMHSEKTYLKPEVKETSEKKMTDIKTDAEEKQIIKDSIIIRLDTVLPEKKEMVKIGNNGKVIWEKSREELEEKARERYSKPHHK
jgi:hypothetical protein